MTSSPAKKRSRDDFPTPVKQRLARSVNYHCSRCDAPTSASDIESNKNIGVGVAAHIKAASPLGARYDASQTRDDRISDSNGIWLCSNCSILIDTDVDAYPEKKLYELKKQAEARWRIKLGKPPSPSLPLPTSSEGVTQTLETILKIEASRQEAIDPRFAVSVTHTKGKTTYELRAKETVPGQLVVKPADATRFVAEMREFQDYGGEVKFENIAASLQGSPLFDIPTEQLRRLEMTSQQLQAELTLCLESDVLNVQVPFHGALSQGRKGVRFRGRALGEIVSIILSSDLEDDASQLKLNIDVTSSWCGKPLSRLPYFERLKALVNAVHLHSSATITIEAAGQQYYAAKGTVPGGATIRTHRNFLAQLEMLREVEAFFGVSITLPSELHLVSESSDTILQLLRMVRVGQAEEPEVIFNYSSSDPDEFSNIMLAVRNQVPIGISEVLGVNLELFGHDYGFFEVQLGCAKNLVRIVGESEAAFGTSVQLSFTPIEGERWTAEIVGRPAPSCNE